MYKNRIKYDSVKKKKNWKFELFMFGGTGETSPPLHKVFVISALELYEF